MQGLSAEMLVADVVFVKGSAAVLITKTDFAHIAEKNSERNRAHSHLVNGAF